MKELYNSNEEFRNYVDKYCHIHEVTVDEALEHAMVRQYAEYLAELKK